jgi:Domain of unknown function (DUF1707)
MIAMSGQPNLDLRATDADREWYVQLLEEAAAVGALSVDELDQRSTAAYTAVYRRDLPPLVADLPNLPAAPPQQAPAYLPAPTTPRPSLFWLWTILPFVAAAAWVHAALVTRNPRYWLLAAVYAIPLAIAIVVAPGTDDELPGWASGIAAAFWIVNAIHAWMARPAVARDRARTRQLT